MAFQEIERGTFGNPRLENSVRIRVASNGHAAHVCVSGDIFRKIGAPTFAKLLVGDGKDAGLVAVVPRNMPGKSTYRFTKTGKKAEQRIVTVSPTKIGLTGEQMASAEVPFEITDDGLVVDVRALTKKSLRAA